MVGKRNKEHSVHGTCRYLLGNDIRDIIIRRAYGNIHNKWLNAFVDQGGL